MLVAALGFSIFFLLEKIPGGWSTAQQYISGARFLEFRASRRSRASWAWITNVLHVGIHDLGCGHRQHLRDDGHARHRSGYRAADAHREEPQRERLGDDPLGLGRSAGGLRLHPRRHPARSVLSSIDPIRRSLPKDRGPRSVPVLHPARNARGHARTGDRRHPGHRDGFAEHGAECARHQLLARLRAAAARAPGSGDEWQRVRVLRQSTVFFAVLIIIVGVGTAVLHGAQSERRESSRWCSASLDSPSARCSGFSSWRFSRAPRQRFRQRDRRCSAGMLR